MNKSAREKFIGWTSSMMQQESARKAVPVGLSRELDTERMIARGGQRAAFCRYCSRMKPGDCLLFAEKRIRISFISLYGSGEKRYEQKRHKWSPEWQSSANKSSIGPKDGAPFLPLCRLSHCSIPTSKEDTSRCVHN